jgi:hypothetical protein
MRIEKHHGFARAGMCQHLRQKRGFATKAQLIAAAEMHCPDPIFAIKALCDQIVIERSGRP